MKLDWIHLCYQFNGSSVYSLLRFHFMLIYVNLAGQNRLGSLTSVRPKSIHQSRDSHFGTFLKINTLCLVISYFVPYSD